MIHISRLAKTEKLFTHIQDNVQTDLAVDRMIAFVQSSKKTQVLVPVQASHAHTILHKRGVEAHRLIRAMNYPYYDPLIWARFEDDTHLLCDGNHRYVAMVYRNIPFALSWILEPDEWRQFQVEGNIQYGSEEELMGRKSGIK